MLTGARQLVLQGLKSGVGYHNLRSGLFQLPMVARTRLQRVAEAAAAAKTQPSPVGVAVTVKAETPSAATVESEKQTPVPLGSKTKSGKAATPTKRERSEPEAVTTPQVAKPKRRRSKQEKPAVILKTEYDVDLATTGPDEEQVQFGIIRFFRARNPRANSRCDSAWQDSETMQC